MRCEPTKIVHPGDVLIYGRDGWKLPDYEGEQSVYPWEGYKAIVEQVGNGRGHVVMLALKRGKK